MSSTLQFKVLEILRARTVEGTYIPFSMALILFRETSAFTDNPSWVSPALFLNCSKLFESFSWSLPIYYFLSNSSTAWVNSFSVLGYKYPAIMVPTPISPTNAPTPLSRLPRKKYPKIKRPTPTKVVITPLLL